MDESPLLHFLEQHRGNERLPAKIPSEVCGCVGRPSRAELAALERALTSREEKFFVAELLFRVSPLPEVLYQPLLDASIDERNPSANRWFVEPCVKAFGATRVIEGLLKVLQAGSSERAAGAVNASYWVRVDSDAAEVRQRMREALLVKFIESDDLDLLRSIVSMLNVDPADYPLSLQPRVAEAIAKGRNSSDPYIRHRIEVQVGNGPTLLQALPPRK